MKQEEKTCYNCGRKMRAIGQYHWHDSFLGDFSIPCKYGEYYICDCGEERLAYSLCLRIENAEQERISQAIMNMAHNSLSEMEKLVVTAHDLEQIMHVSRQAISKNRKLKTLVFHFTFKKKTYYLYESVMRFLEKGDGRYDLSGFVCTTTDNKSFEKQRMPRTETEPVIAETVATVESKWYKEGFLSSCSNPNTRYFPGVRLIEISKTC